MCVKTSRDRVRNDIISERVGVAAIVKNIVETRLRWFWTRGEETFGLCSEDSRSNGR